LGNLDDKDGQDVSLEGLQNPVVANTQPIVLPCLQRLDVPRLERIGGEIVNRGQNSRPVRRRNAIKRLPGLPLENNCPGQSQI